MASLKSMHVFLPLSIVFFLCVHLVAAHRKININKPPINSRVLMSSSTFYNAFDATNPDNPNAFNHNAANKDLTHVNSHNYENSANNEFNDIVDSEFNTNSYTNSHINSANLPLSSTNTHQAHGVQYGYPTTYGFSSPSSSSTPSLYGGKFPNSFEASLSDVPNGPYGKQSFPSNDQQGLYGSPDDAKSFSYSSPSRVDASPSKEQSLSQSPSNYEASYSPFHQVDELKHNNRGSDYGFKNEKPVTNYDSFFNSPTIHKNEVEGSTTNSPFGRPKFPFSDHDLTYGHVQVP